jgi:serine/threonine protein kinase/WD40 repeat protein
MAETRTCRNCGAEVPEGTLERLCPRCLARVVLGVFSKTQRPPVQQSPIAGEQGPEFAVGSLGQLTEKPGGRIGPYRLLEKIGEGGCGVVYLAEQEDPIRRVVALKVVKLGMDTRQVIARFGAERQALALMDHPNIAKVLDAGATATGRPYFVMELVRGIKITEFCDQNNLSMEARLSLFQQVCHAIQHAHQKGVIHRDLKPSNILVSSQEGVPVPKIIDFGIAKATGGQILTDKTLFTAFEQFIGTPAYMSPEQAELSALDVDTRSDIYALGVLLYELLTGQTPFDTRQWVQAGLDEVRRTIREQEPLRPSTKLRGLHPDEQTTIAQRRLTEPPRLIHRVRGDLDWIVMKCLEKDRRRRYETADGLAMDIERHLRHEPVSAAAPDALYRTRKFLRRNKAALSVAGALVLLLTAGTVVSVSQAVLANRAQKLAERHAAESRENLWASYLTTARASRTSGRPGRRFDALDSAAKAAAIRPSVELRSEAASALGLVDTRTAREWKTLLPRLASVVLDQQFERYAQPVSITGPTSVRRVSDDQELILLEGELAPVQFSPDGRFLMGVQCSKSRFGVWNLETGRLVLDSVLGEYCPCPAFHPLEPIVAACVPTGTVSFFNLASGKCQSWTASNIPCGSISFRPDGQQLAVGSWYPPGVRVYDRESGQVIASLSHSNLVRRMDWSADGRWLATPCDDGCIYLWNMGEGGVLEARLAGHDSVVSSVAIDPQGEFLVSQGWDGTSALWSLPLRSLLLRLPGCDVPLSFSANGRWLGPYVAEPTVRVLEVARAPAYRVLPAHIGNSECNGAFSPEGRWIIIGGDGLQCWDTRTAQPVWSEPVGEVIRVRFRPDGKVLLTSEPECAREWSWSLDTATGVPRLGQPRRVSAQRSGDAEYSRDGSVLAVAQVPGLAVFDRRLPAPLLFPMKVCNFAALSPDGRWAAGSPWASDRSLKVWDLTTQTEAFCRTNIDRLVGFTADGRWLLLVSLDTYDCIEVGTWRTVSSAPRRWGLVTSATVSRDGRWFAVSHAGRELQLFELPKLSPLLTLSVAAESPLCFSPDSNLLLTRRSAGQFALWDVSRLRQELTPLGLGW